MYCHATLKVLLLKLKL